MKNCCLIVALVSVQCITMALKREDVDRAMRTASLKKIFTMIYETDYWSGEESISGGGSHLSATVIVRKELPRVLEFLGVQTLLDASCGDFHWMKEIDFGAKRYIGADIVQPLIDSNQKKYGNEKRSFVCLDITSEALPLADAIICRDCLAHLSIKNVMKALKNFKASGATYLIATTYYDTKTNKNIFNGSGMPYNLLVAPFNLPQPILIIDEAPHQKTSNPPHKTLGIWRLADIILPD